MEDDLDDLEGIIYDIDEELEKEFAEGFYVGVPPIIDVFEDAYFMNKGTMIYRNLSGASLRYILHDN